MSKRKRVKDSDRIGKPGEAEAFDRGATSGPPSLAEVLAGIKGAFDDPDAPSEEEKKKRRARAARARKRR